MGLGDSVMAAMSAREQRGIFFPTVTFLGLPIEFRGISDYSDQTCLLPTFMYLIFIP